jgi:phosphoesterase RecJ-like protein
VIKQEAEDQCTVGFRSKERIDVSAIAARFGGGGHRLASGLSIQGNIESVKALLLDSFAELFTEDEFPEEPSWDNAYPSSEKAVSNKD